MPFEACSISTGPIRALAAWENYDISTYGLTDRRSASELPGNIGPSLLTLGPDVGRALKKLAKRMLMATRRGLEPLTSAVTGRRSTLLN